VKSNEYLRDEKQAVRKGHLENEHDQSLSKGYLCNRGLTYTVQGGDGENPAHLKLF